MLWCFCMVDYRPLSVPICVGTNLLVEQCRIISTKMEDITFVSYASAVGSLKYVMICTRGVITQH